MMNLLSLELDKNFFENIYYGNTVKEWCISFSIIIASWVFSKLIYWFFANVFQVFTARTKNKLDDVIVDMIQKPTVFIIIATGIWFGLTLLKLHTTIENAINNSFHIVMSVLVAWLSVRLFDAAYEAFVVPWVKKTDNDLDDQLMPVIRKGIKSVIWVMAIIIGMDNAGHDVGALLAGLGIGGLALAMAAKDTVSNVFGGFTIFSDQPFRISDRVKVAGYDGKVSEIGIRTTRLITLDGREVSIPNSKFADAPVENVSREPSRKIVVNLGLTYDTPVEKIEAAMTYLREICEAHESTEEKIIISFNQFGDFALNIMFIYYIKSGEDIASTQNDINLKILRKFNDNGLEFAFPTQTIHNVSAG